VTNFGQPANAYKARALGRYPPLLLIIQLGTQSSKPGISLARLLTALMVTHDTDQAERMASRAILINAGRLILDDTVQKVLHAEADRSLPNDITCSATSVVTPYVRAAVKASLIPSVNNLRSLGIVWIPGVMAGSNPIVAAIYQFVVVAMLFATAGTTSLLCTLFVRRLAFSRADQLTLRAVKD
jgi:hypothetical protein